MVQHSTRFRDVLIFSDKGQLIASRNEDLQDSETTAGFFSAISSFITMVMDGMLSTITIGEKKLVFQHAGNLLGTVILSGKNISSEMISDARAFLEDVLNEIGITGAEKAKDVLARHFT